MLLSQAHELLLVFPFGGRATRLPGFLPGPPYRLTFVKAMLASVDALDLLRLSEKAMPTMEERLTSTFSVAKMSTPKAMGKQM